MMSEFLCLLNVINEEYFKNAYNNQSIICALIFLYYLLLVQTVSLQLFHHCLMISL